MLEEFSPSEILQIVIELKEKYNVTDLILIKKKLDKEINKNKNNMQIKIDNIRNESIFKILSLSAKSNSEINTIGQFYDISKDDYNSLIEDTLIGIFDANSNEDYNLLKKWINETINSLGEDFDIKSEVKLNEDISFDDIEFEWRYYTRCDDYDNYGESGGALDMLENFYGGDDFNINEICDILYNVEDNDRGEYCYSDAELTKNPFTKEQTQILYLNYVCKDY